MPIKKQRVPVYMTEKQKQQLIDAVEESGESGLAPFLLKAALKEAKRVLK